MPMILKPSPSSGETTLVPIQIQITPDATIIVPAAKSGLNNSLTDFDNVVLYRLMAM